MVEILLFTNMDHLRSWVCERTASKGKASRTTDYNLSIWRTRCQLWRRAMEVSRDCHSLLSSSHQSHQLRVAATRSVFMRSRVWISSKQKIHRKEFRAIKVISLLRVFKIKSRKSRINRIWNLATRTRFRCFKKIDLAVKMTRVRTRSLRLKRRTLSKRKMNSSWLSSTRVLRKTTPPRGSLKATKTYLISPKAQQPKS